LRITGVIIRPSEGVTQHGRDRSRPRSIYVAVASAQDLADSFAMIRRDRCVALA
jgi:hypothetical protein